MLNEARSRRMEVTVIQITSAEDQREDAPARELCLLSEVECTEDVEGKGSRRCRRRRQMQVMVEDDNSSALVAKAEFGPASKFEAGVRKEALDKVLDCVKLGYQSLMFVCLVLIATLVVMVSFICALTYCHLNRDAFTSSKYNGPTEREIILLGLFGPALVAFLIGLVYRVFVPK